MDWFEALSVTLSLTAGTEATLPFSGTGPTPEIVTASEAIQTEARAIEFAEDYDAAFAKYVNIDLARALNRALGAAEALEIGISREEVISLLAPRCAQDTAC